MTPPARRWLAALAALAAALGLLGAIAGDAFAQAAPLADPFPSFVALRLNGQPAIEGALILRAGRDGRLFFLSAADAGKLRFDLAARVTAVRAEGEDFFPLEGVPGLTFQFDEIAQVLSLTAAPEVFAAGRISLPPGEIAQATRPGIGAFLTYDVISQRTSIPGTPTLTGGQAELGIFTPQGVFTQSAVGSASGSERSLTRLDSLFTIDQPAALASWRIGDSITRSGGWSPLARFGGIQYGTNFATQPALVTYPLHAMSGRTALPSVVDVYVNNVLSNTLQVPAGPFTLNDLPTVNGQGELRLVVRDLLGREQVFLQPLYGSTTLLREGLNDWTAQAGALRENYGVASNEYGPGFASGLWRRGINDDLTLEGGAEAARSQAAAGAGATWLLGQAGQFTASGAWSQRRDAPGCRPCEGQSWSLAWERRSTTLNFGAQARVASDDFRTVTSADVAPARREAAAFGSYGTGAGSVAAGYARIDRPGEERVEFAQVTLSRSFREWGFLSLTAVRSLAGPRNDSISLNYALPIDFMTTAGASTSVTENGTGRRTENRLSIQRSVPTGDGYGYRLDVSDQQRAVADVRLQNRTGLYSLEASRVAGGNAARVGASGSLTYIANEFIIGRRVEDAFGLVQVPGFPNVRVYLDNQELGRTNANGNLFVSRLRPYQVNRLSIEQLDIPLSAEVITLKLDATPYLKSGVVVRFPVKASMGGIAHFVDESGADLPSGSVVTLGGEAFPVAERGQAYLTGLAKSNPVRVSSGGRSCGITIAFQPGDDPQPFLGTFTCKFQK